VILSITSLLPHLVLPRDLILLMILFKRLYMSCGVSSFSRTKQLRSLSKARILPYLTCFVPSWLMNKVSHTSLADFNPSTLSYSSDMSELLMMCMA
jgi:hypothetical protein